MDAKSVLTDLTEISAQIRAAVVVDLEGRLVESALLPAAAGREAAEIAAELLRCAERAAGEGPALLQLEAVLPDASVALVRGERHAVVAVTRADPVIGLVLYDLKRCLDLLEHPSPAGPPNPTLPQPKRKAGKEGDR